jgi:hypothetical protein
VEDQGVIVFFRHGPKRLKTLMVFIFVKTVEGHAIINEEAIRGPREAELGGGLVRTGGRDHGTHY